MALKMYSGGIKRMKNNEILKRANLSSRFVVEVFNEKSGDVSFSIMPAGNTLEDTILAAWESWDDLPLNGHKKADIDITVSRQIIEETETGLLRFFDHENCEDQEIAEYARSFNYENIGLYHIGAASGREMDELREYVRSWGKGEPLDDIDISHISEDDFLELLYQKNLVTRGIIESYKKYLKQF